MATVEQLAPRQNEQLNQEIRHRADTETWLAEALNGSMRTSFEFRSDGYDLFGEDGGSLREVFDDAVEAAKVITSQNPNLLFEFRRRLIEAQEFEDMLSMARGEGKNTMVVISDFPPELMDEKEEIGGYNVNRQQTMMRVITRRADGTLRMVTQSLDRSNRQGLEAIYARFARKPQEGELLGQRIHADLEEIQQDVLADHLTATYDQTLAEQYGGNWHAGIQQDSGDKNIDTYRFARDQVDLIEWFVSAKLADPAEAENLRFKLAATASDRFAKAKKRHGFYAVPNAIGHRPEYEQAYFIDQLNQEVESATRKAIMSGQTYSGCGASVSADSLTANQLEQSGYGNKTSEKSSYSFNKKMHCVSCQAPPKKGEGKKACGPCGLCRNCDKKFGGDG